MILGTTGHVHSPWANTFKCYPELYFKPYSISDVQSIVRHAAEQEKNVVVVGAGHSPSTITRTLGWLVSLDNCDEILAYDAQDGYTDVTVEAGIRLATLSEELDIRGLALQNLGSISEQSVAGVISTGTHGSSCYHGLISEQFVSLDVVIETGEIVTVSESENKDLFEAVLLGLGAFGIIVRATIRCLPAFNVESKAYVMDFDELLSDETWSHIFLDAEFHRIWWYPYANKCYVWQGDKTKKPREPQLYSFYGTKLGRLLYEFFLWITVRLKPNWTPMVERWLFRRQFNDKTVTSHVGRSDHEINMDCLFKQFVNEWTLPLVNGPQLLSELRNEINEEKWYVHSPIEIRASNTTLPSREKAEKCRPAVVDGLSQPGPVYGNVTRPLLDPSPKLRYAPPGEITNEQLSLNLNATMFRPFRCDPPVQGWYKTFESLCSKYGGKPHWAKIFYKHSWTNDENQEAVKKWQALRTKWASKNIFGGRQWLAEKALGVLPEGHLE